MPTPTIEEQASSIARDILNSISLINFSLKEMENDPMQAMRDQVAAKKIEAQAKILYAKILKHSADSPEAHRGAFQKKFTFPSRFIAPATLETILAFIYIMMLKYEQTLMSPMFRDADHIMYAQSLSEGKKTLIAGLLIKYWTMITGLIAFIVIGGLVAYFMTNSKEGAVEGAVTGGVLFFGIMLKFVLPIMLMIFLFKACFG